MSYIFHLLLFDSLQVFLYSKDEIKYEIKDSKEEMDTKSSD